MLSEVRYGTFANYSPRGKSELSEKSRRICGAVKAGRREHVDFVASALRGDKTHVLNEFFTTETTLVPIPGSTPPVPNGLWAAKFICERFVLAGLGRETLPCIQRISAVPKSAFAAPGERPTITTHYNSIRAIAGLFTPAKITLVDDVLTRGRTSYAAARRALEAFPEAEIRVFAILRTQGFVREIAAIREPSVGRIFLNESGTDVDREP